MNLVVANLEKLATTNYVRKANPSANYWFDFSKRQISNKEAKFDDDFYLIIYGSTDIERDFFVIPYRVVKAVLIDQNLVNRKAGDNRIRWIGNIVREQFKITHSQTGIDVSEYHGNADILAEAMGDRLSANYLSAHEADFSKAVSDEMDAYRPEHIDSRTSVWQQIKARRGQSAFRDSLRARYGDHCMISGCRLMDVVEAAHVKPYRGTGDHHPENGLLLRADLHTLYDLDLIGIEPETLIIRVHPLVEDSTYRVFDEKPLLCETNAPSTEALYIRWKWFKRRMKEYANRGHLIVFKDPPPIR